MAKPIGELEAEFFRRKFAALKSPKQAETPSPFMGAGLSAMPKVGGIADLPPVGSMPKVLNPQEQAEADTQAEIDRRFGKGDWWGGSTLAAGKAVGQIAETPVIKQLLDAISVFNYAGANIADENLQDIEEGDWNPISGISNLVEGVGRGISGAAGNKNDATTYSDVIKRGQRMAGIDTESEESQLVAGIGGFVGDVALDPTTYIGVGLAKGAIKGANQASKFGRESKLAKATGQEAPDHIRGKMTPEYAAFLKENSSGKILPTSRFKERERVSEGFTGQKYLPATSRMDAFRAGAKMGQDDFRKSIVDNREARKARKNMPETSAQQVDWLVENIDGLRPAVIIRTAEEVAKKQATEAGVKLTEKQLNAATADILSEIASRATKGAQTVIPGTKVQRQVGKGAELDQARLDHNMRRNDEYIAANGGEDFAAGIQDANKVEIDDLGNPVPKGRQEALFSQKGFKGEEAPPITRNTGADNQSDLVSSIIGRAGNIGEDMVDGSRGVALDSNGNLVDELLESAAPATNAANAGESLLSPTSTSDDILNAILGKTDEAVGNAGKANPESVAAATTGKAAAAKASTKDYALMTTKLSQYKKLSEAEVVYAALSNIRVGDSGNIRDITKALRSITKLNYQKADAQLQKLIEDIAPLANSTDPTRIAKYITDMAGKPEFKAVSAALRRFSDGGRVPAASGDQPFRASAKLSAGTEEDINVIKTPATPEQGQAFLNAKVEEANSALAKLDPEAQQFADDLFQEAIGNQKLPGGNKRTKRGAFQSGLGPDQGSKFPQLWNTHAAIAYSRSAINYVKRSDKFRFPSQQHEAFTSIIRSVEARLRQAGVDVHMSNMSPNVLRYATNDGTNTVMTVRLGLSDVLDALPRDTVIRYLFTPGQNMPPTLFMDMAELMVRSASTLSPTGKIDMERVLTLAGFAVQGKLGRRIGAREMRRTLDQSTRKAHIHTVLTRMGHKDISAYLRTTKKSVDGRQVDLDVQDYLDHIDEVLGDGDGIRGLSVYNEAWKEYANEVLTPFILSFVRKGKNGSSPLGRLVYRNMENTSAVGADLLTLAKKTTDAKYSEILSAVKDGSIGQVIEAVAKQVDNPGQASDIRAATQAMDEANIETVMDKATATKLKKTDKIAKANVAHRGSITRNQRNQNNAELYETEAASKGLKDPSNSMEETAHLVNDKTATEAIRQERAITLQEELYDVGYREANANLLKNMFGLPEKFNASFGRELSWDVIRQSSHAGSHITTAFHKALNDFARKGVTQEVMGASIKRIQNAHLEGVMDSLTPLDNEIYRVLNFMFDSSYNNFFNRNSVGPQNFIKNLKEDFGEEWKSLIPDDFNAASDDIGELWKTWNIQKPYDFLSKMMNTMIRTSEEVSMGAAFSTKFGSKTPQPGFVKIIDTSGKDGSGSEFYKLIDNTLFYPKEVANEMVFINKTLTESRYFTHHFITHAWDPIISTIKMTQTTLKPGHHVMSVIGDGWRNSLAGMGKSVKEYGQMGRIMRDAIGEEKALDSIDAFGQTRSVAMGVRNAPGSQNTFETLMINGKKVKVERKKLWELMNQRGVVLPAHIGGAPEDFLTDFNDLEKVGGIYGGIAKVTKGIDNVVNHNGWLNRFSARRDSMMRGALFLNTIQKKKFKTLEEAADYAANHVKKWAPVATDLATWESKVARRAIFYYTWIRGITPRIIETALTRPGLAMVPSKAMYNLAVMNGLDPMSFGDPFPEDGPPMPYWYAERVLGPQWMGNGDMMGLSPTGPVMDVFNSLGSGISLSDMNPFRGPSTEKNAAQKMGETLLGMSTPWIKTPYELATMRRIDSGAPIEDAGQYLTDILGPGRTLSKMTGKTITGANRSEALYQGGMDPETAQNNMLHELINWFTGSQLTNYTSDAATKSAEFQQRDKLRQQAAIDERMGN